MNQFFLDCVYVYDRSGSDIKFHIEMFFISQQLAYSNILLMTPMTYDEFKNNSVLQDLIS